MRVTCMPFSAMLFTFIARMKHQRKHLTVSFYIYLYIKLIIHKKLFQVRKLLLLSFFYQNVKQNEQSLFHIYKGYHGNYTTTTWKSGVSRASKCSSCSQCSFSFDRSRNNLRQVNTKNTNERCKNYLL